MNTKICITSIAVSALLGIGGTAQAQTVSADELAARAAAIASSSATVREKVAQAAESAQAARALTGVAGAFNFNAYTFDYDVQSVERSLRSLNLGEWDTQDRRPNVYVTSSLQRTKEQLLYTQATAAMDEKRWDRALDLFTQVAAEKGERLDGALYWKAYVQNKLGQRTEALATIQELVKAQPNSRWISDAKALEVEVRSASGQPVKPEAESDDDLKLLALGGLVNADPEQSTAILQKLLQGPQSRKVKQRALFVLSQSKSPKALDMLVSMAKGSANPDLQREALNYLCITGAKQNQQVLSDIYAATAEKEIKRRILQAYMMAGDRDKLLAAAKSESDVALRVEAVRQLGMMHASEPLSQMLQTEVSTEVRRELLRAFMMAGDAERLAQIGRADSDVKLRVEAVRSMGMMGKEKTAASLVELYGVASQAPEVRQAIISALYMQGNAKALVDIARKETNPELRKQLVRQLSTMKAKEATDFMMEIINK